MKNRARSSSGVAFDARGLAWAAAMCAVVMFGPTELAAQASPTPEPGTVWVIFGTDTVVAEVAGTGSERSTGLQDRDDVPPGTGMLFTFDRYQKRSFWMKDVHVGLDLAVFDELNFITEILTMEAETLDIHDTETVVYTALEVPAGWFAAHGIGVGSQATLVLPPHDPGR